MLVYVNVSSDNWDWGKIHASRPSHLSGVHCTKNIDDFEESYLEYRMNLGRQNDTR